MIFHTSETGLPWFFRFPCHILSPWARAIQVVSDEGQSAFDMVGSGKIGVCAEHGIAMATFQE